MTRWARTATCAALLLCAAAPASALPLNATVGIEARGTVDLDGRFLPSPPLSSTLQAEVVAPFTRSVVSVGDAQSGVFSYAASADIGTLALRVAGSLSNAGATDYFGQGVPVLQTVAEARDVITLSSASASPYDVTLQLLVSGVITEGANSQIAANSLISLSSAGVLKQTDSGLYDASGVVNDTLSVTLTVAGPSVVIEIESLLSLTVLRAAAGETVSADLSNTALLSLILPSGVTIASSQSGTFGVPIAVPEPALAAPIAIGAWATAAFRARRRRA